MITSKDIKNHSLMLQQQKMVFRRNSLLTKAPHIGSNTVMTIGRCMDEYDYEDPIYVKPYDDQQAKTRELVREWAIYVRWEFEPETCESIISCNPYFPKTAKCSNLPMSGDVSSKGAEDGIDTPFSFTVGLKEERYDVCQPVCYENGATGNNFMGLYTRFSYDRTSGNLTNGKCYITDPLLLAFYLDPSRRVLDPSKELLEDSGFNTTTRLLGNPRQPTVVAKIPPNYCDQYGLERVEESERLFGETMYTCALDESPLSLSTLTGTVLTRAIRIGLKEVIDKVKSVPIDGALRLPPTKNYLRDRQSWLENVKTVKKPLPFPLKCSDLGIVAGTVTEWMLWTDVYWYMCDNRNDQYGGRLIERNKRIAFGLQITDCLQRNIRDVDKREGIRRAETSLRTDRDRSKDVDKEEGRTKSGKGERYLKKHDVVSVKADVTDEMVRINKGESDINGNELDVETRILKSIQNTIDHYRSLISSDGLNTLFSDNDILNNIVNQVTTQSILDTYSMHTNNTAKLSRLLSESLRGGVRVHTETLGYALANSTIVTNVEKGLLGKVSQSLKSVLRLPKTTASVLQLISFIGFAVDLFSAVIYDPLHRYNRHFSDKTLLLLAQAELEWNAKFLGTNRLIVKPYEWIINTPYYDVDEEIKTTLILLPSIIQSRSLNSNGSLIKRDLYNYIEVNDSTHEIVFSTDNTTLKKPDTVIASISDSLDRVVVNLSDEGNSGTKPDGLVYSFKQNGIVYYILLIFIVICISSINTLGKNSANLMFPIAILFTVTSIALPLGVVSVLST